MALGPPHSIKRDAFINGLAGRLGVAPAKDERPTAQHRRVTENTVAPDSSSSLDDSDDAGGAAR